jgi:hypothetical protein
MSSPEFTGPELCRRKGALRPLLDAMFGFFVWAVHFVAIYIATTLACRFGFIAAGPSERIWVLFGIGLTVFAIVVVGAHSIARYRQQRGISNQQLRLSVTIGGDAIASLAIAWQLLAIALVPACV